MFRRQKPIVLRCYTALSAAASLFPVGESRKYPLKWMPQAAPNAPSIRGCPGIRDYAGAGFVLPLWTDVRITAATNILECKLEVADRDVNRFKFIMPGTTGGLFAGASLAHLKIVPPWFFRCSEEIKFYFSGAFYHLNTPDMLVCPGHVDYVHQLTPTMQTFIRVYGGPTVLELQAGTPLAHIIPLTERPVQLEVHHVSADTFTALGEEEKQMNAFFSFGYYRRRAIKRAGGADA